MLEEYLLEGNKYFKWYWSICNRAKCRVLSPDTYVEKHHIYPKSIYGQNQDLVKLTAKEHYMVHLLLWWGLRTKYGTKDKNTRKMAYAFTAMNMKNNNTFNRYNSKLYSFLKIVNIESKKGSIISNESRKKMSKSHLGKKHNMKYDKYPKMSTSHEGNSNHLGKQHNKETILKMSSIKKDKKQSIQTIEKRVLKLHKIVYQYCILTGILINKYNSKKEAYILTGVKNISRCCNNIYESSGGFIWSFNELKQDELNIKIKRINIQHGKNRSIIMLDNDIIKEYNSITFASNETGISVSNISSCLRGKSKTAGNFIWKYKYEGII